MATEVFINIRDLPELTDVKNGDYIIVETSTGTSIIDFQNFIIPTTNTILTTTVSQNTQTLIVLSAASAEMSAKIDSISSTAIPNTNSIEYLNTTVTDLNTKITNNTTSIDTLNSDMLSYVKTLSSQAYTGKVQITIRASGSYETGTIDPLNVNITSQDIVITPANYYAALHPAYIHSVTNGAIKLSAVSTATEDAIYNVMAFK